MSPLKLAQFDVSKLVRILRYPLDAFQSLAIKLKLSIIIALIVIFVITIFSMPVLFQQEKVLKQSAKESGRFIALKLSQDLKNIFLCEVTQECTPEGSTEEKLELLMRTHVEGLRFAFAVNKNGKITVKPDSIKNQLALSNERIDNLLQLDTFETRTNASFIEYYYPVNVRKQNEYVAVGAVGIGFSRAAIEGPVAATKRIIYSTAALVIILTVLGVYFLAQRMVTQVTDIVEAARQVGVGNLDVHVHTESKDELGLLTREFNNMVTHLREKLHMQKFVSKLTVQMIQEKSGSRLAPAEGERHHVTIIFTDVRNFTTIAERLEPEQIVRLINIYFQLQTEVIEKHGGIVDKFMGDQIMAIFPTGVMLQNSMSAAIEIQQKIRELNARRAMAKEVTLHVGIGINHGPAVLGNMGSRHRMDYTVIGDVVNIAARLCSIAKAGQIIAAYGPLRNLNGEYRTTRLQPIIVKGRTRPVEICQVDYDHQYIIQD